MKLDFIQMFKSLVRPIPLCTKPATYDTIPVNHLVYTETIVLLLIIIYISFISLGLPDPLLGSAWPLMHRALNVPLPYAGYLSMIICAGTVVSSFFSGSIIARFKTGMVTAVSVLMTACALIGFSFSNSFLPLCLFAIPLGLGAGSVDAALNNYVALHYKARHMSWLHCFWGIGTSIGPLIMSAFLMHGYMWNIGYRSVGILQFCLCVVLFAALPLWQKSASQGKVEEGEVAVPRFTHIIGIKGVKTALMGFFCYCAIELTAGLWGASYLVTARGIAAETAAQWIALFYIGITAGRFLSGFLTFKLDNRSMVRLGQALIALGVIVLALPIGNGVLLPAFFLIGLGCAPIYPSLIHATPDNFGAANSQAVIGLQMAGAYVGNTLVPPLFGQIAARAGFGVFPWFLGGLLVLQFIMVEVMFRSTRNRQDGLSNLQ